MKTTFKELLERGKQGEKFIGCYMMVDGLHTIEVLKMAGYDFLILDMEHERLTLSEIMPMIYACEACGIATVVRVPGVEEEYIKKALDMGASCIKVPDVRTVEDAKKIVEWAKYPPQGHRGACPFVRGNGYGSNRKGCWERANQETVISVLIEGPEGIKNMNDIIAVEGVDHISVGQIDLAVTLGCSGDSFNPKVIDAVLQTADVCQKYGKQLSAQVIKPEDVRLYKNHPAITQFHTDMPQAMLYKACKELCDGIHAQY